MIYKSIFYVLKGMQVVLQARKDHSQTSIHYRWLKITKSLLGKAVEAFGVIKLTQYFI